MTTVAAKPSPGDAKHFFEMPWTSNSSKRKRFDVMPKQSGDLSVPQSQRPTGEEQTPRRSTERAGSRGRQPSLRHVKNSTEVLRQLSKRRATQDAAPDGKSSGREGRQFTVANVGNNGKIYLRCVEP